MGDGAYGIATWTVPIEVTIRVGRTAVEGKGQTADALTEVAPDFSGDLDPASPREGELDGDLSTARDLANYGDLSRLEQAPIAHDLVPPAVVLHEDDLLRLGKVRSAKSFSACALIDCGMAVSDFHMPPPSSGANIMKRLATPLRSYS